MTSFQVNNTTYFIKTVRHWSAVQVRTVQKQLLSGSFGLEDVVYGSNEWALFFDSSQAAAHYLDNVIQLLEAPSLEPEDGSSVKKWSIPVCYDLEGPSDWDELTKQLKMDKEVIIQQLSEAVFQVEMTGFLPGFSYLSGLPESFYLPRREKARGHVPAGSLAMAHAYCGIYPTEGPGGWHILGNCPLPLFDVRETQPMFLNLGDQVQFFRISKEQHRKWYKKFHSQQRKEWLHEIAK
ncbi:MAG: allophanate hydrolase subunit 1 [Cyclobacteriaceae bacterium]|nr:carboxyltransferase domain-containing protein [Cyclobacteriaceae bacterium]MCH8516548.1 allophanate hydrolase subunit 1 [Cyclobacteriaceae bacterium]